MSIEAGADLTLTKSLPSRLASMQRRDAGSVLHKADDRKLGSPAYNCCWVLPVARPRSSPELGVRARASRPTDLVVAALGGSAAISSVTRETVRDGAMTDPTTRTSAPTAGCQVQRCWSRRAPVAARSGDRLLSEPTAGARPCRQEPLFMPHRRPSMRAYLCPGSQAES